MLAVNGYYDGNVCLLEEQVTQEPQKVIITFLEKPFEKTKNKVNSKTAETEKLQVLKEVQELWKYHDNSSISVDEYLRNMRKGRQSDIR